MRVFLALLFALVPLAALGGVLDTDQPIQQPGQVKQNVFGPGIHQDAYGRPVEYRTKPSGERIQGPVKQDVYGPGIGQDAYGRPVEAYPAN
jgi:hypothetical protein